ncbi:translocation and assembly module TamA [Rubricella aquisinus]|uniref:Translocation and assembly module TamA n=1 Tax=Rubricella aquisinus TaxID=2028108 RepID=A0A840X4W2_9RHOB|nr:autotransporter assembly complex family protein [Rubricella aquisinus]MBB5516875.1 translocation and assembly module TamA [Rubricella aquisinus]
MSLRKPAAICALFMLAACGEEAAFLTVPDVTTPVRYDIEIVGAPDERVEEVAEDSLALFVEQEDGAPSLAFLRRRAEGDVDVLESVLRADGYILPEITVLVTPPTEDDPDSRANVRLQIEPGRQFILETHQIELLNSSPVRDDISGAVYGSPVGKAALASPIISAEDAAVASLQRDGYAYARFLRRDVLANPEQATLTVTSQIDAGTQYTFGETLFEGVETVELDYLRTYIDWDRGEIFDGAKIRALQQDLARTELFTSVSVDRPEDAPEGGELPVLVRVEERKPRTFSVGVRLNTDLGLEVGSSVVHRNLLGQNETVGIRGEVNERNTVVGFDGKIPQYRRSGQDLVASIEFRDTSEDAFDGQTASAEIGLERQIDDRWRGGVGLSLETANLVDSGVTQNSLVYGLPITASYDSVRDKFDPRNGARLTAEVTPYIGEVNNRDVQFLRSDAKISFYRRLDDDGGFIFATRFRVGSILADDVNNVPAPLRLFAGGGGSVRGFVSDGIGPRDAQGDPRGGLSVLEAGAEVRLRFTDTIGGVGFAEAGIVNDSPIPDAVGDVREAAGLGLRYFSPVGPIRADIAVPLDRRPNEDRYQFYLSIGQAF